MSQGESASKWAALLQPIKELERNWDIDIAGDLTGYLEELSGLTFTVDGVSNLDFGQAAMVLQCSSCTYGKKVEYLLKLTTAALDNSRAKQQDGQPSRRGKGAKVGSDGDDGEEEQAALGVADLLRAVVASGCSEHALDLEALADLDVPEAEPALLAQISQATRMPTVAQSVGHARGAEDPAQSSAAAMSASDAPTFNLLGGVPHASGAVLLMQCDGDDWDERLCNVSRAVHSLTARPPELVAPGPTPSPPAAALRSDAEPPAITVDEPEISLAGDFWGGEVDDADDGADGGYDDGAAAAAPLDAADTERPARPLHDHQRTAAAGSEALYDPYQELDPHSRDTANEQPFKRKVPREPRFCKTVKQARWQPFAVPSNLSAGEWRLSLLLPDRVTHQRACPVAWPAADPPQPSALMLPGPALEAEQPPDDGLHASAAQPNVLDHTDAGFDVDAASPESFAFDDAGEYCSAPVALGQGDLLNGGEPEASDADGGPTQAPSYDDLVTQYTRAVAAAATQVTQSALSRKVTSWRDCIGKIMVEQDARPAFDVHRVGQDIVETTSKLSTRAQQTLPFHAIVRCQQKYEVARCFSAFLQRINDESIELIRGKSPADPFYVKIGRLRA